MKRLNWKIPEDQIDDSAARFFHKINITKEPKAIHDLIKQPRTRKNATLTMKTIPKKKPFTKLMINSMATILNRIPEDLKYEKPHLFKKKLKDEIKAEDKSLTICTI